MVINIIMLVSAAIWIVVSIVGFVVILPGYRDDNIPRKLFGMKVFFVAKFFGFIAFIMLVVRIVLFLIDRFA